MKKVKIGAFQGDVAFVRVESVPDGAILQEGSEHLIAHSETGHHHVALGGELYTRPDDGMTAWLVTTAPVVVEHRRAWDTHDPLELLNDGEGEVVWEIRRQREYTPEGWRRVED